MSAEAQLYLGLAGIVIFILLVMLGMRLAFAAILTAVAGYLILTGPLATLKSLGTAAFGITSNYGYSVIPLFVAMGFFSHAAGFADDLFSSAKKWVGGIPGGLLAAVILGGAGFAAVCGSSVASAGVLSKVALSELEKYNYDRKLSVGCIAATGTLAILIPPSFTIVIYCIMVEQSVTKMLIAGILPGLLTAAYYIGYVVIVSMINPKLAPPIHGATWKERFGSIGVTWPMIGVAVIVMGGLYSGWITATEAGAVGAAFILMVGIIRRRMNWSSTMDGLTKTIETTCMVLLIVFGVLYFARFLAYTQVTYQVSRMVVGMQVSPIIVLIGISFLYFILGMFMEPIGMMALTLPIIFPAIKTLGIDPILFGIIVIIESELSMLTPPVGLNLFVVSGLAPHIPFEDIVKGVIPFVLLDFLVVATLIVFPQVALFLPSLMN